MGTSRCRYAQLGRESRDSYYRVREILGGNFLTQNIIYSFTLQKYTSNR